MAARMAVADGAMSAAGTWAVIDATALLNSEANATAMTTSYVESAAFTPGAITIDGIAVLVASRVASPTGTISIRLAQAAATVVGTEVTINVSDIDQAETWTAALPNIGGSGWYFFKFAAPVLLVVATAYTVSAKCSVNGEVTLNRNATAGNWSRLLRTTTTGAPAAGDNLWIQGEWTAAATKTNRAVTMDSTATTDYGDGVTTTGGFCIGKGGTLTWGTTAATNYILRLSTNMYIHAGGTMTIGTVATPVPRDGSAQLQFDCGADGDFGLYVMGTFTAQGLSRTVAKIIDRCKLNGDEAAAQTVLSVDTDTGWLNNDDIALAGTTRTVNQSETRVLSGGAGATTVTVTAGLTNAHSGTAPTQAEMILLTRNVKILSVSTTFMTSMYCGIASVVDCDWTEFRYMGVNATRKRGIEVCTQAASAAITAGSASFTYCSIRNFERGGLYAFSLAGANGGTSVDNFTFSFCVGYLVGSLVSAEAAIGVYSAVTTTNWSIADCTIISGNNTAGGCFYFKSLGGTIQRIVATNGSAGITTDGGTTTGEMRPLSGTLNTWTVHSCTGPGIGLNGHLGGRISTLTVWRCNGSAQQGGIELGSYMGDVELDTISAFGNGTVNIGFLNNIVVLAPILIRGAVCSGDTTFATATGFQIGAGTITSESVIFENCTFGVASGIFVAHTGGDLDFQTTAPAMARLVVRNTLLSSATPVTNLTSCVKPGGVFYQKKGQVANTHQTQYGTFSGGYTSGGLIDYDASTFKTAAPSEKLTPATSSTSRRLRSQIRRIPVRSGEAMAISVWVQKSALYTGSQPRLRVLSNAAIGLNIDSTLDTAAAAVSVWEQLTGTCTAATGDGVLEVFVDCDGAAGSVYVDDWAAAVA